MMQQYWFFAEPLKHEATACLGPYYLASDVEALESAAIASALRVKELTLALERLKAGGERVMALGDEADCELAVAVFVEIASRALMGR
jgi:hypothetical protein